MFKKYMVGASLLLGVHVFAADTEIRHITPPQFGSTHLGKQITCHRPMRRGTPEMSVQRIGDKIVAHDYGHGGSGWTLGPGSASYVNKLLIDSEAELASKDTPLTIIGSGALGLFTTYDLHARGFTNITVVAKSFENLTSHNAGGLLAPVSMDNSPEMQAVVDKIGIDAYKFYETIAKGTHPDFKEGAVIVPAYFESREESGLEPYVGKVMEPAKDVTLDFGNGTTRNVVAYDDGIFIDTAKMMAGLNAFLREKGVTFEQREVTSFDEIPTKYIINCTGLGSGVLNNDPEMVSVQGHLIMLKDQVPPHMQYMILMYFGTFKTASGMDVKRSLYVFPKHLPGSGENDVGVFGGTFIEGGSPDTPNEEEFDIMLQNAKKFYGIKE